MNDYVRRRVASMKNAHKFMLHVAVVNTVSQNDFCDSALTSVKTHTTYANEVSSVYASLHEHTNIWFACFVLYVSFLEYQLNLLISDG